MNCKRPHLACDDCPLSSLCKFSTLTTGLTWILSPTGRLLWASPHWKVTADLGDVLGSRWLEFVHEEDLEGTRRWLADPQNPFVRFRLFGKFDDTEPDWRVVGAVKEPLAECCWLVVGCFEEN